MVYHGVDISSPAAVKPTIETTTAPSVETTAANACKVNQFNTNASAPVTLASTSVPDIVQAQAQHSTANNNTNTVGNSGFRRQCSSCKDIKTDKSEFSVAQLKKPLDLSRCKQCVRAAEQT